MTSERFSATNQEVKLDIRDGIGIEILCSKGAKWLYVSGIKVLKNLFCQLSPYRGRSLTKEDFARLADESAVLLVAVDLQRNGHIIGIARLVVDRKGDVRCGIIHDVVVDAAYRGQGVAKSLVRKLVFLADRFHLDVIELTLKPVREVANYMYQSLGFKLVSAADPADPEGTNHYRLDLTKVTTGGVHGHET